VGWAIVVGRTKRHFQIANLLEVNFKLECFFIINNFNF
jgi:hypothetical protein